MKFKPGPLLEPEAEKARAEAIERSEQSRAEREAKYNKPKGANVPPGWKPHKRPAEIEAELDSEISIKTKKGII